MFKIMVDRLHEGPETLNINCPARAIGIESEPEYAFDAPVTGAVEFKLVGRDVMANGSLHTAVGTRCVRCLAPVVAPLDVPVQTVWLFHDPEAHHYKEPEPDEILAEYHNGESIEPDAAFRETLLAELPEFPLCREDCRGLCPRCGANLNIEQCSCAKQEPGEAGKVGSPDWRAAIRNIKPVRE